ncbi:hypothetical protein D3C87_324920 [compost metagenome]
MTLTARFPIGTQYLTRGKRKDLCTVVDVLRTYNSAGELVSIRYVTTHDFCGQSVKDHDVVDTTIAMGLTPEYQHLLK